jgi:hypothetical protein
MSLYNLLFGMNPNTDVILAILGLKKNDVERFRDCGFEEKGIWIRTRTGGGNREDYPNIKLTTSPYYLSDEDDDFDSTYATYYFEIPDEIKEDVEQFKNIRENGISGKLIQWVLKTLEREETEHDIYARKWEEQGKLVQGAKAISIYETNGHTVVPLDDSSLDRLLKLMEEANGLQLSYSVMPYKTIIEENVPKWNFESNKSDLEKDMCRVKVSFPKNWEIDLDLFKRWELKFAEKYPKSINTIREAIQKYHS